MVELSEIYLTGAYASSQPWTGLFYHKTSCFRHKFNSNTCICVCKKYRSLPLKVIKSKIPLSFLHKYKVFKLSYKMCEFQRCISLSIKSVKVCKNLKKKICGSKKTFHR